MLYPQPISYRARMAFLRRTCTRAFREGLAALYPGLGDNRSYWRMIGTLIFPRMVEHDTGTIVIPHTMLARLEGEEDRLESGNYRAYEFLEAFQRDVLPDFRYADEWSYVEGEARTVTDTGLAPEIDDLVEEMHRDLILEDADRVYLDTGTKFRRADRAKRRRQLRERLNDEAEGHAKDILLYQNDLDVRTFRHRIDRNKRAAYDWVQQLAGVERKRAVRELLAIVDQPKPFLKSVPNSERVYSAQFSLQNARSELRDILMQGWGVYDLKSAQAGITARVWDVPALYDLLASGGSLWEHLADELDMDVATAKPAFKIGFYALSYGAGRERIHEAFVEETGDPGLAERFLEVDLVRAIYDAREERMEQALAEGEIETVFGSKVAVGSHREARSALSQQVQAAEVALILPIYDLAFEYRDRRAERTYEPFTITLYLFDGVAVQFRDRNRIDRWEARIQQAVRDKAESLGIPTELERELAP